jgi:hypothetical protein
MKFLCLGYFDREKMAALSETEVAAAMEECAPHLNELYASGRVIVDTGLGQECRSLRRVADKLAVIDGPFAETKELIAGYWIWQVKSLDEAVDWVKRCPNPMPTESEIEIRPFYGAEDFADIAPDVVAQEEKMRDQLAKKQ